MMELSKSKPTGQSVNYVDTLELLGYPLKYNGEYIQTKALYRDGNDPTSLVLYPNKNLAIDFVTGEKFTLEQLVAKSLNLDTGNSLQEWFDNNHLSIQPIIFDKEPKIKIKNKGVEELKLVKDHSYFINRGISYNTLTAFDGGVCNEGKIKGRYAFPVKMGGKTVGYSARTLKNHKAKWMILGEKKSFVYPWLNYEEIFNSKRVILTEGIPDVLSLYEVGIKNSLSMFGIDCSNGIINFLLRECIEEIVIATNNDSSGIGQDAAQKLRIKLSKYFNSRKIHIILPQNKDINDDLINLGADLVKKTYDS